MCGTKDDYLYYVNILNGAIIAAQKLKQIHGKRYNCLSTLLNDIAGWMPEYFIKNNLDVHFSGTQGLVLGTDNYVEDCNPHLGSFRFSFCLYRKYNYKVYCYIRIFPGLPSHRIVHTEIYTYGFREILRTCGINKFILPGGEIRVLNEILEENYTL